MSTPHVNKSTPCAGCGHAAGDHCQSGMPHFDAQDHRYSCITEHCVCGPCQCPGFRNPYTLKIRPWTRPTLPETPCARCSHPKQHHCRKGSTGIIGLDGAAHTCSHYLAYIRADFTGTPECSDTRCAEILDAEKELFCSCSRFRNPYLQPRKKRAPKPMSLFTQQERQELFDKVQAQQPPRPKTRAEKCESDRRVLLEIVRDNEFPGVHDRGTGYSRIAQHVVGAPNFESSRNQVVAGAKEGK